MSAHIVCLLIKLRRRGLPPGISCLTWRSTSWLSSGGPSVTAFEHAFAHKAGCEHSVACASSTIALHLTLAAIGVGRGDEVIIPASTMIAVANAVRPSLFVAAS